MAQHPTPETCHCFTKLDLQCVGHVFIPEDAWAVAMAAEAEEAAARELQRLRDEEAAHRLQAAEVRGAQVRSTCLPRLSFGLCLDRRCGRKACRR